MSLPARVADLPRRDLSERELIARIRERLPPPPAWLLVGIGDDAAVVEPERNRVEVLSVDALVEGVHFDRAFVPPDAIGHRALAVNLSDLAAMGAAPRLALLSMALPPRCRSPTSTPSSRGFAALAARHRLHLVGGNLTRSPGPLMIDVTVVGTVKRRQALTRGGARPGDELYVSGTIGAAAAGLRAAAEVAGRSRSVARPTTRPESTATEPATASSAICAPSRACAWACCSSRNRAATRVHGSERRPGRRRAPDRRGERRRRRPSTPRRCRSIRRARAFFEARGARSRRRGARPAATTTSCCSRSVRARAAVSRRPCVTATCR